MADLHPAPVVDVDSRLERVYTYADESGAPLYRIARLNPKAFYAERALVETGQWAKGMGAATRRVIYRLAEVIRAVQRAEVVYIVEGEKDADALAGLGLCATTKSVRRV
jgi:hypothetical protein